MKSRVRSVPGTGKECVAVVIEGGLLALDVLEGVSSVRPETGFVLSSCSRPAIGISALLSTSAAPRLLFGVHHKRPMPTLLSSGKCISNPSA